MTQAGAIGVAVVAVAAYMLMRPQQKIETRGDGESLDPVAQAIAAIKKKAKEPDWGNAKILTKPPGYWDGVCDLFGCY